MQTNEASNQVTNASEENQGQDIVVQAIEGDNPSIRQDEEARTSGHSPTEEQITKVKADNKTKKKTEQKKFKRASLFNDFYEVKLLDIELDSIKPAIKASSLEFSSNWSRREETYRASGIDPQALVGDVYTEKYCRNVKEFAMERKEVLGVRPDDVILQKMRRAVNDDYSMVYRGETGLLS